MDEAPLAFVDLEMTGLDREQDRVLQICLERVTGGRLEDRLCSFVRPDDGRPITAQHIHGICEADVENAPSFAELAGRITSLLSGAIFVAHGAEWDLAFIAAEMQRASVLWKTPPALDTLPLSRRAFRRDSHRLYALAQTLGITVADAEKHRADHDVAVLRELFDALVAHFKPATARELWLRRHQKRQVDPEIIRTAERAAAERAPVAICYRPSGRSEKQFTFHVKEVRRDLDPPVVLGYLQRTRGRRELRGDRIVSIELLPS